MQCTKCNPYDDKGTKHGGGMRTKFLYAAQRKLMSSQIIIGCFKLRG